MREAGHDPQTENVRTHLVRIKLKYSLLTHPELQSSMKQASEADLEPELGWVDLQDARASFPVQTVDAGTFHFRHVDGQV